MVKTLDLSLGEVVGNPNYATGWYRDSVTGQLTYYDAVTGKWYVYAAGYLYPLEVPKESAPKTIAVAVGDRVKITISYYYQGPAIASVEEYFSIGYTDAFGYHPEIVGTNARNLPQCTTPTRFTSEKTLTIPTGVRDNWTDIECKVWHGTPDVPETGLNYQGALEIVGLVAEITDFTIVDYNVV